MKENLLDWFLDRQLKFAVFLGLICILIIFLFDFRAPQAFFSFLFSLLLIFAGHKLYLIETTENWLKFSYARILKNIIGGALLLIGWGMFLRTVLALAIAVIISKIS
jgi:hypothetical protein